MNNTKDPDKRFTVLTLDRQTLCLMLPERKDECCQLGDAELEAIADQVAELLTDGDGPFWEAVSKATVEALDDRSREE